MQFIISVAQDILIEHKSYSSVKSRFTMQKTIVMEKITTNNKEKMPI
jgi:hypothetical protein